MKTLEQKRELAKAHLASQATEHQACMQDRLAFARYCDRRSNTVEQIEEIELDLMIEQWQMAVMRERMYRHAQRERSVQLLFEYDKPEPPPAPESPPEEPT